jgi:hypothetical protein
MPACRRLRRPVSASFRPKSLLDDPLLQSARVDALPADPDTVQRHQCKRGGRVGLLEGGRQIPAAAD